MRAQRVLGLATIVTCLAVTGAAAQGLVVHPGAEVRITTDNPGSGRLYRGTVLPSEHGEIRLAAHGRRPAVTVPVDDLRKLEIRTGGTSRGAGFLKGFGGGFLAGFAFGALVGVASYDGTWWDSAGQAALATGIGLGTVLAPIGGLIGLASSGADWTEVELPSSGVGLAAGTGGGRPALFLSTVRRF